MALLRIPTTSRKIIVIAPALSQFIWDLGGYGPQSITRANSIVAKDPGAIRTASAPLELRRSMGEVVFLFFSYLNPEGAQDKSPGRQAWIEGN